MLLQNIISAALLLAVQLNPAAATPMQFSEREVMAQKRSYFSDITGNFTKHFPHELQRRAAELSKRTAPYHPEHLWSDSGPWSQMGWHWSSLSRGCDSWSGRKWYFGYLVRMVSFPNATTGKRDNEIWRNTTEYYTAKQLPNGQTQCHRFGSPTYNPGTQCVDKIKIGSTWQDRTSLNTGSGWYTGTSVNGGRQIRDIWDCLLNRTAVEYRGTHPDIGYGGVVQYYLGSDKYYRFYDDNNFAWFAFCFPSDPLRKRQSRGKQNYNPIWDYLPPRESNPFTDRTPITDFDLQDPVFNGRFSGFDPTKARHSIYYFPPAWNHYINIDGQQCGHIAVSRPGLRHWTVRLYYEYDPGYAPIENEYVPTVAQYNPNGNY